MSSNVKEAWRIQEFVDKVKDNVEERLIMVGVFVQGVATNRCVVGKYPKGSGRIGGRLRSSITYATNTTHSDVRGEGTPPSTSRDGLISAPVNTVRIGTNVEYAIWVELGIKGNAPNANFLRGAIEENLEKIKQLLNLETPANPEPVEDNGGKASHMILIGKHGGQYYRTYHGKRTYIKQGGK